MSDSGEHPHCQCPTPTCGQCGRPVKAQLTEFVISKPEDTEKLLLKCLRDFQCTIAEVQRACNYTCKSHLSISAERLLADMNNTEDIIKSLCQEVGLEDVTPLITFLKILCPHDNRTLACREVLEKYQETVERLSPCVECSSSPTTPTHPPVLVVSAFPFFANSAASAPPENFPGNPPGAGHLLTDDIHDNLNDR